MFRIKWDDFRYSSSQFGLWRIAFGFYLLFYYIRLFPYAVELFSHDKNLPPIEIIAPRSYYPQFLLSLDSTLIVQSILGLCIFFSALIMIGFYRRFAAFGLWILVMWLFNRNTFTDSPEYAFINWLIFALIFIPQGEKYSFTKASSQWYMPRFFYWGGWILLGLGYFFAGSVKFKGHDVTWMDGTAMYYVVAVDNARFEWFGDLFKNIPPLYFLPMTYGALCLQTFAPAFIVFKKVRPWWWLVSTGVHVGLLFFVNLAEVSFGMIVFHLFLFDESWLTLLKVNRVGGAD